MVRTNSNSLFLSTTPIVTFLRMGAVGLGLVHSVSQAATIEVTSDLDNGTGCTLREALESIDTNSLREGCDNSGSVFGITDTINFSDDLSSNTITLTSDQLSLNDEDVLIDASNIENGITVNANNASRVFNIDNNSTVTLDNLMLFGGNTTGNGGGLFAYNNTTVTLTNSTVVGNSARFGGGLYADYNSRITLNNSIVSGNSATASGGGLIAFTNSTIELTNNSTVSGNLADNDGGGLYAGSNSTIELSNSTVSGNTAADTGGGLFARNSSIVLTNSTVSNNSALTDGGGLGAISNSTIGLNDSTASGNLAENNGGGFYTNDATLRLINSTISNNSAAVNGGGLYAGTSSAIELNNSIIANSYNNDDVHLGDGTLASDSASIIEESIAGITGLMGNPRTGVDPGLLELADNGRATQTHALRADSIARDSGILATCTETDQRGVTRNNGDDTCDVGAIEFFDAPLIGGDFFIIPLDNGLSAVVPL